MLAACGSQDGKLSTPESVLHDTKADVYLISNLVGAPLAKDNNGRIARMAPDGRLLAAAWIEGGRNGVELHAPKGLCLVDEVLWVADIDVLRRFDRNTGAPLPGVPIPGASFLNDVSAAPDGTVYCTDSGLDASFQATGTDAIWRVGADLQPQRFAAGPELGQPNGIVAQKTGVYVVSWRDGSFALIDGKGHRTELLRAPMAQLDGLLRLEATDDRPPVWLATSWAGACIYRFDLQGGCTALPARLEQPADFGYDAKRKRLLVPLFGSDRVEFVQR
jgi:hypothetical protein